MVQLVYILSCYRHYEDNLTLIPIMHRFRNEIAAMCTIRCYHHAEIRCRCDMSGFGIAHISHFVFHKILFFPFESVFMQPGSSFFGNQIERGGRIYLCTALISSVLSGLRAMSASGPFLNGISESASISLECTSSPNTVEIISKRTLPFSEQRRTHPSEVVVTTERFACCW